MFEIISLFEYCRAFKNDVIGLGHYFTNQNFKYVSLYEITNNDAQRKMLRPFIPLFMIGFTVYIDVWLHNNPRDIIFESQPFVIKMFIKTYRT